MKGDYIMRKMYSKKQIEEIAKSSVETGGKVYLHNILINTSKPAYLKLYTASNTPFDC